MGLAIDDTVVDQAEQARLIDGMARLVSQVGYEQLVSWPIFLPINHHFPDRVRGTIGGVRKLLRRLLSYADLGDLFVSIEVFDSTNPYEEIGEDGAVHRLPEHTAAWFAGIVEDTCRFGLDVQQLSDGEHLVGILCHEVAHAFRHQHGIEATDRQTEEELTDLTTVLLGFGVLTTNNSYRYRSGVDSASRVGYWSERGSGYLLPVQMSFLLALQSVVREVSPKQLKRIRGSLELNQREMFDRARQQLVPQRDLLQLQIGVPPRSEWPPPATIQALAQSLTVPDPNVDPVADNQLLLPEQTEGIRHKNSAHSVYRLAVRQTRGGTWLGGLAGVFITLLVFSSNLFIFWGTIVACALLGRFIGHQYVVYECTDSECLGRLKLDDTVCPGCGGRIRRTLSSAAERLEALDEDDPPDGK